MDGVTLFIPVLDEESIIEKNTSHLVNFMDSLGFGYEVILGSNGSTDGTIGIGERLSKEKKISFFHLEKKGVGDAFKKALRMAKYDYVISLDMDLSVDMSFVKKTVELVDSYDIIIGSKQMGYQERSLLRRIPSFVFTCFVRTLLGIRFKDFSMAAKAYKKDVALKYVDKIDRGTSYVIDIIYLAYKDGFNIVEIPVRCNDRRKSKFNILNESFYRFRRLIRLWLIG